MSNLPLLFWHRNDLRTTDNVGLEAACQRSTKIVGLFCLDTHILAQDDVAPARVKYMIGCLEELQQQYQHLGSSMLIVQGKPEQIVPQIATELGVKAVYWNKDVEPYAKARDLRVVKALETNDIEAHSLWDRLLHYPGEVLTQSEQPYKVYTPFWRNWQQQTKPKVTNPIKCLEAVDLTSVSSAIALPTADELGFAWENPLPLQPGSQAAQAQLTKFCDRQIQEYDQQRNFPATPGTSLLSAALKFGAISIRTVWQATTEALANCRSDEARENIITWQKELAWREFYHHCLYFFPELAAGPYREQFKNFPWENNPEHFQAWCKGQTGYPIVDAAMRQLNQTGWMHNRCRMIVASFLTKDLITDWRWGEQYFMQKLFDGDLAANNGGWQWSASSGMDPKPLRIFNPASQAKKFDPEAEYIRQWLPEIRTLGAKELVTGKISSSQSDRYNYPQPIVDHKVQQQKFKELYKMMKSKV